MSFLTFPKKHSTIELPPEIVAIIFSYLPVTYWWLVLGSNTCSYECQSNILSLSTLIQYAGIPIPSLLVDSMRQRNQYLVDKVLSYISEWDSISSLWVHSMKVGSHPTHDRERTCSTVQPDIYTTLLTAIQCNQIKVVSILLTDPITHFHAHELIPHAITADGDKDDILQLLLEDGLIRAEMDTRRILPVARAKGRYDLVHIINRAKHDQVVLNDQCPVS